MREEALQTTRAGRENERGAVLITVLMLSTMLLLAGGALIMTTSMTASNAFDSTTELQAYYAAEAGLQETLRVLRGNTAPAPLFAPPPPTR
jgi:Tfp pilus assembly protein PilX